MIRSTDLLGLSASYINKFSTGETTRLGIAGCLINDPQLLIMDEPTTGLDPIGRASAISLIRELGKDPSKTIFISSHILSDIERFCTHVGIVSNGKLIFKGSITEVKKLIHHSSIILELEGNIPTLLENLNLVPNITNIEVENHTVRISITDPAQSKDVTSTPGKVGARVSKLYKMLKEGHHDVKLSEEDMHRIIVWLDSYSPFYGVYEPEGGLAQLRGEIAYPTLKQ